MIVAMKEKHTQMWSPNILRRRQYIWPWYILSHHHVWHCTYQQIYQKLLKKYWYPGVPSGGRWDIYDPDIFYSPTHVWHCFCLYCQRNKNTMITRQHTTVRNSDVRVNTDRGDNQQPNKVLSQGMLSFATKSGQTMIVWSWQIISHGHITKTFPVFESGTRFVALYPRLVSTLIL